MTDLETAGRYVSAAYDAQAEARRLTQALSDRLDGLRERGIDDAKSIVADCDDAMRIAQDVLTMCQTTRRTYRQFYEATLPADLLAQVMPESDDVDEWQPPETPAYGR